MTNRSAADIRDASPGTEDARAKFAISLVAGLLSMALVGFGARKLLHLDVPTTVPGLADTVGTAADRGEAPRLVDLVIQSPVAEAAMVFRGNTHVLPYNTEIASSDTPELIEVTAPGHEGRRFWVKVDRPRSFMVTLPTGGGAVDATYDETVAALGDAIVRPADNGVVANGVVTNSVGGAVPNNVGPNNAMRPQPAAAPSQRLGAKANPTIPEPKGATAAPAVPQPAQPPAAPVAAAPPPVVTPTPAVGVAAAPQIPPGTVDAKGVRATVKAHSSQVSSCYERARMDKPDLAGRVVVSAGIDPSGGVTSASVTSSTAQNARFETCLVGAFRSWTFPAPAGGVPGSIAYTFVFD
jgi:TonB family protein